MQKQDIQAGKTNAVLEFSQVDKDAKLTINHNVDDANTISPSLSLKSGYLTYTWLHLFGDGATLKTKLDPFNVSRKKYYSSLLSICSNGVFSIYSFSCMVQEVDLEWSDPGKGGSWVTKANVPLKEPKTATLSFKRKFSFF